MSQSGESPGNRMVTGKAKIIKMALLLMLCGASGWVWIQAYHFYLDRSRVCDTGLWYNLITAGKRFIDPDGLVWQ